MSSEANNFYKDVNAPHWYNVYLYYHKVLHAAAGFDIDCTEYAYTIEDATFLQPAALWGSYRGISAVNRTYLNLEYKKYANAAEQLLYFYLASNLSILIQDIYRTSTPFHDHYVIHYINKYKDKNLAHWFDSDHFNDMGIAQWAGGFITDALCSVRAVKQLVRDGMWRFGEAKYNIYHLEFSSYAILQGFPYSWLYDLNDARMLLDLLASDSQDGLAFRRHIVYIGSTYIGDNIHYTNSVGDIGEVTFTREANFGNFNCSDSMHAYECSVLATFYNSSAAQCAVVQALYTTCAAQSNGCKLHCRSYSCASMT